MEAPHTSRFLGILFDFKMAYGRFADTIPFAFPTSEVRKYRLYIVYIIFLVDPRRILCIFQYLFDMDFYRLYRYIRSNEVENAIKCDLAAISIRGKKEFRRYCTWSTFE